jgi:hypothetical protein
MGVGITTACMPPVRFTGAAGYNPAGRGLYKNFTTMFILYTIVCADNQCIKKDRRQKPPIFIEVVLTLYSCC